MTHLKQRKLSTRLLLTCIGFSLVLSISIGSIGYFTYYKSIMKKYQEYLTGVLSLALDATDGDDMENCIRTLKKSPVYENTQKEYDRLRENTNIEYLYLLLPVNENETDNMMYVLTGTTARENEIYDDTITLGDYSGDEYPVDVVKKYIEYMENGGAVEFYPNHTEFGYMYTGVTPVLDSNGEAVAVLSADIPMDEVYKTLWTYIAVILFGAGCLTVIFLTLMFRRLNQKIAVPINRLAESARNFVQNSHDVQEPDSLYMNMPVIKTGDEIERLAGSLARMSSDIRTYMKNLSTVVSEKERIQTELNVATQIQADMLPSIFPAFPNRKEFDIYASMSPAKEVGGDFYDFFLIDEDHLAVVMADVSGKGVPAALFMVIAKTLIKNHAQNDEDPKDIFTQVNQQLCEGNESDLFVTAWIGILTISTNTMVYANAGHNPPLIQKKGQAFSYLKCRPGFILAGMENTRYVQAEIMLEPGDSLFLYTDGVTEATDSQEELYGEERLMQLLNKNLGESPENIINQVRSDIDIFTKGVPQFDDITMLCLKIND